MAWKNVHEFVHENPKYAGEDPWRLAKQIYDSNPEFKDEGIDFNTFAKAFGVEDEVAYRTPDRSLPAEAGMAVARGTVSGVAGMAKAANVFGGAAGLPEAVLPSDETISAIEGPTQKGGALEPGRWASQEGLAKTALSGLESVPQSVISGAPAAIVGLASGTGPIGTAIAYGAGGGTVFTGAEKYDFMRTANEVLGPSLIEKYKLRGFSDGAAYLAAKTEIEEQFSSEAWKSAAAEGIGEGVSNVLDALIMASPLKAFGPNVMKAAKDQIISKTLKQRAAGLAGTYGKNALLTGLAEIPSEAGTAAYQTQPYNTLYAAAGKDLLDPMEQAKEAAGQTLAAVLLGFAPMATAGQKLRQGLQNKDARGEEPPSQDEPAPAMEPQRQIGYNALTPYNRPAPGVPVTSEELMPAVNKAVELSMSQHRPGAPQPRLNLLQLPPGVDTVNPQAGSQDAIYSPTTGQVPGMGVDRAQQSREVGELLGRKDIEAMDSTRTPGRTMPGEIPILTPGVSSDEEILATERHRAAGEAGRVVARHAGEAGMYPDELIQLGHSISNIQSPAARAIARAQGVTPFAMQPAGTVPEKAAPLRQITGPAPSEYDQALDRSVGRARGVLPFDLKTPLDQKAHKAATSPVNLLPEPTQPQKEAGNYKKGHAWISGLNISIENPQGSTRAGVDASGKPWENTMQSHYGYIRGTLGKDKDHIDAFLGPQAEQENPSVFVVDQIHPETGKFDEHKVMIGYPDQAAAVQGYNENYAPDWKGLGAITAMSMDDLKAWVRDGRKTQPVAYGKKQEGPAVKGPEIQSETGEDVIPPETPVTPEKPGKPAETPSPEPQGGTIAPSPKGKPASEIGVGDIDDILGEIDRKAAEMEGETEGPKPPLEPREPREPRPPGEGPAVAPPTTPGEKVKASAEEIKKRTAKMAEIISRINAVVGSKGVSPFGKTEFSQSKFKQLLPLFNELWLEAKALGMDVKEFVRNTLEALGVGAKDYFKKWVNEDLRRELSGETEKPAEEPPPTTPEEPKGPPPTTPEEPKEPPAPPASGPQKVKAYHWSKDKISGDFDLKRLGENTVANNPDAVESAKLGAWFTEQATPISENAKEGNAAELTLNNPLVLTNANTPAVDVMGEKIHDAKQYLMDEVERAGGGEKLRAELQAKGHDGIVLEDSEFDNKKSYVVFDKSQIAFDKGDLVLPVKFKKKHAEAVLEAAANITASNVELAVDLKALKEMTASLSQEQFDAAIAGLTDRKIVTVADGKATFSRFALKKEKVEKPVKEKMPEKVTLEDGQIYDATWDKKNNTLKKVTLGEVSAKVKEVGGVYKATFDDGSDLIVTSIKPPKRERYEDVGEARWKRGSNDQGTRAPQVLIDLKNGITEGASPSEIVHAIKRMSDKAGVFKINVSENASFGVTRFWEAFRDKISSFPKYALSVMGGYHRGMTKARIDEALVNHIEMNSDNGDVLLGIASEYVSMLEILSAVTAEHDNVLSVWSNLRDMISRVMTNPEDADALANEQYPGTYAKERRDRIRLRMEERFFNLEFKSLFTEFGEALYGIRAKFTSQNAVSLEDFLHYDQISTLYITGEMEADRDQEIRRPRRNIFTIKTDDTDRNGENVTPDQLMKKYNLSGAMFGNWAESPYQRQAVNLTWDAFRDLANSLGIPLNAIGLPTTKKDVIDAGGDALAKEIKDGTVNVSWVQETDGRVRLVIAYGARGRGGKAAATYHHDHTINLTKMNGDGTLAHEWAHGFDIGLKALLQRSMSENVMPEFHNFNPVNDVKMALKTFYDIDQLRKDIDEMLRGMGSRVRRAGNYIQSVRDHLNRNLNEIYEKETWYYKNAKMMDGGREGEYWSDHKEMWSRAFEAYVADKLQGDNTFLVDKGFIEPGYIEKEFNRKIGPYPSGEERPRFRALLDHFFQGIEWAVDGTPKMKSDWVPTTVMAKRELEAAKKEILDKLDAMYAAIWSGVPSADGLYWYGFKNTNRGPALQPSGFMAYDDKIKQDGIHEEGSGAVGYPQQLGPDDVISHGLVPFIHDDDTNKVRLEVKDGTEGNGPGKLGTGETQDGEETPGGGSIGGSIIDSGGSVPGPDLNPVGEGGPVRTGEGEGPGEIHIPPPGTGTPEPGSDAHTGTPIDYVIRGTDNLGGERPVEAFNSNIGAIRTLNELNTALKRATPEQQSILAKFAGWGPIKKIFDEYGGEASWDSRREMLMRALSPEEYRSANESILTGYLSPPSVIDACWDALGLFGFKGGRVLESASGPGRFIGLMPQEMRSLSQIVMVEKDPVSAKIAAQLYQRQAVVNAEFEKAQLPSNYYDVNVTNVPFFDSAPADAKHNKSGFPLHDYYINKGLDLLRDGGIGIYITSTGTMDKSDSRARKEFMGKANFLGAIRLPVRTFAGTHVGADILFFQKPTDKGNLKGIDISKIAMVAAEVASIEKDSEDREIRGEGSKKTVFINKYFKENPDMVIGNLVTNFHGDRLESHLPASESLTLKLKDAILKLPANIYEAQDASHAPIALIDMVQKPGTLLEGEYFVGKDGKIWKNRAGVASEVDLGRGEKNQATNLDKLKQMIAMRDIRKELLYSQALGEPREKRDAMRARLNKAYDAFVKQHGYILSRANNKLFIKDADSAAIFSLEHWNDVTEKAVKTDVFTQDLLFDHPEPTSAESPKEALGMSLGFKGRIDFAYMEKLTGFSKSNIIQALNGQEIFNDPEKGWVTAAEYLSGAVKAKLKVAEAAAKYDKTLEKNVEALKAAAPKDIEHFDIRPKIGAVWVPVEKIQEFGAELGGVRQSRLNVTFVPETGEWFVAVTDGRGIEEKSDGSLTQRLNTSVNNVQTWGTMKRPFLTSGKNIMGHQIVTAAEEPVTRKVHDMEVTTTEIVFRVLAAFKGDLSEQGAREFLNLNNWKRRPGEKITWNSKEHTAFGREGDHRTVFVIPVGSDKIAHRPLLEDILNNKDIIVKSPSNSKVGKLKVDIQTTNAANAVARRIKDKFQGPQMPGGAAKSWLWENKERKEEMKKLYNDTVNVYAEREHDGSHLHFPGKVSDTIIELYKHQKNSVWRFIVDGTSYLAHEVGTGKTFTLIASIMESKRLGIYKRPMLAVRKGQIPQFLSEFKRLYPAAKIHVANIPSKGDNVKVQLNRIANSNFDAVIISHEQLGFIPLSVEYETKFIQDEIDDITAALRRVQDMGGDHKRTETKLQAKIKKLEDKLRDKIQEGTIKEGVPTFEQLGIDYLGIDEAHMFKNVTYFTNSKTVKGFNPNGSARGNSTYLKLRYLQDRYGKGIMLASGTPLTNSVGELYTVQRLLNWKLLRDANVHMFDSWVGTFGQIDTKAAPAPEGGGYRLETRFSRFINIPELMAMSRRYMDIKYFEEIAKENIGRDIQRPNKTVETVKVPRPEAVYELQLDLMSRAIDYRDNPGDATYPKLLFDKIGKFLGLQDVLDNLLRIIDAGRKIAMDQRLFDRRLPDTGGTKTDYAVDRIVKHYFADVDARDWGNNGAEYKEKRGTQLVFCDTGVPAGKGFKVDEKKKKKKKKKGEIGTKEIEYDENAEGKLADDDEARAEYEDDIESDNPRFSIYEDMKEKLIAKGIPAHEIAFMQDYKKPSEKARLFDKVNSGVIRIVIGSTPLMGIGVNMQKRIVAMHHLDVHWNFANWVQRNGRGWRFGNNVNELQIYNYAMAGTVDEFMWHVVAEKGRVMDQIMSKNVTIRELLDISQDTATAEELVAAISNNPIHRQHLEVKEQVRQLQDEQETLISQINDAEMKMRHIPLYISTREENIAERQKSLDSFEPINAIKVGDKEVTLEKSAEASDLLAKWYESKKDEITASGKNVNVGKLGRIFKEDHQVEVEVEKKDEKGKVIKGEDGKPVMVKETKTQTIKRFEEVPSLFQIGTVIDATNWGKVGGSKQEWKPVYVVQSIHGWKKSSDLSGGIARAVTNFRHDCENFIRKTNEEIEILKKDMEEFGKIAAKQFDRQGELDELKRKLEDLEAKLLDANTELAEQLRKRKAAKAPGQTYTPAAPEPLPPRRPGGEAVDIDEKELKDLEKTVSNEDALKFLKDDYKLNVEKVGDAWRVWGNTFSHKKVLRDAGGQWNARGQFWAYFQGDNPAVNILEMIKAVPSEASFSFAQKDGTFSPKKVAEMTGGQTSITLEDLARSFKNQTVEIETGGPDGKVRIKTKTGHVLTIESVNEIEVGRKQLEVSYGKVDEARGARMTVRGGYSPSRKTIYLKKGEGTNRWVLEHETEHWMEDIGLITPQEVKALKLKIQSLSKKGGWVPINPKDVGGREDRANWIARQMIERESYSGTLRGMLDRIAGFVDAVMAVFGIRTAAGVVRTIESGKVFDRAGKAEALPTGEDDFQASFAGKDYRDAMTMKMPANWAFQQQKDLGVRQRQTMPPAWIAKRHEEFKKLHDRQDQREEQRKSMGAKGIQESEKFLKLQGKDLEDITTLIWGLEGIEIKSLGNKYENDKEGDVSLREKFYTDFRKYLGRNYPKYSAEVLDAYVDLRRTLDKDFAVTHNFMKRSDEIDRGEIAEYRNAMNRIHNYFPHTWNGSHFIEVKDKAGNTLHRDQFNAPFGFETEAKRRMAQLEKRFPGLTMIAGKVTKMPEEAFAIPIPVVAMEAVMNSAMKRVQDPEMQKAFASLIPKAMADELKVRGFAAHMVERKNVPGYEKKAVKEILYNYKMGLYGYLTKMEAARDFSKIISKVSGPEKPVLWGAMQRYIGDMLENSTKTDRVVNTVRALFFFKYLGGNIKTAALNLTQNLVLGIPRLGMEIEGGGAMRWMKAAARDLEYMVTGKSDHLSTNEKQLLKDLYENGIAQSNFLNEVRGQIGSNYFSWANKVLDIFGKPMELAERFNRASLALAAFRAAREGKIVNPNTLKELGLKKGELADFEQAKAFAETVVKDAHFAYGKGNRPEILRGSVGKIAVAAYTFRTFSHNLINVWTWMWKEGGAGRRALMKSMATSIVLGGLTAVPLYATFMNLMRQLTGDDWGDEFVKKLLGNGHDLLRDIIVYGMPAAAGFNIGGSLSMELPVFDKYRFNSKPTDALGAAVGELIGVPWAMFVDADRAIEAVRNGQSTRSLESILPTSIANILKASRLATQGDSTISGRPIGTRKLTTGEAVGKMMGFQPTVSSKSFSAQEKLQDFQGYKHAAQERFANRIAVAIGEKDLKRVAEVRKEMAEWNKKQVAAGHSEYVIRAEDFKKALIARTKPKQAPKPFRAISAELKKTG